MSLELASTHYDGLNNADCRPRLTDSNGNTYLLDSGSMTCVVPADATDVADTSVRLETVDGSPFTCYGKKELEIKIGLGKKASQESKDAAVTHRRGGAARHRAGEGELPKKRKNNCKN